MTIFHEIYGAYYRITARLLRRGRITRQDIADVTAQEGFRDSMLFLPQKLIPQADGSDWGLLRETADGAFEPVTKHLPLAAGKARGSEDPAVPDRCGI